MKEESQEIGFNAYFPTIGQRTDGQITVNNIIMIFVDMDSFKEVKIKFIELNLQMILAESKLKALLFSQQCLAVTDLLVS